MLVSGVFPLRPLTDLWGLSWFVGRPSADWPAPQGHRPMSHSIDNSTLSCNTDTSLLHVRRKAPEGAEEESSWLPGVSQSSRTEHN